MWQFFNLRYLYLKSNIQCWKDFNESFSMTCGAAVDVFCFSSCRVTRKFWQFGVLTAVLWNVF